MPKKNIRKCSICRKPGHMKNACKTSKVKVAKAKKTRKQENKKTKIKKTAVKIKKIVKKKNIAKKKQSKLKLKMKKISQTKKKNIKKITPKKQVKKKNKIDETFDNIQEGLENWEIKEIVKEVMEKRAKMKELKRKPSVIIQVLKEAEKSPHIVNLRNEEKESVLNKLPIYAEKIQNEKIIKKELDLAQVIKQANRNKEIEKDIEKINKAVKEIRKIKKDKDILNKKQININRKEKNKKIKKERFIFKFKFQPKLNFGSIIKPLKPGRLGYQVISLLLVVVVSFLGFGYYQKLKAAGEVVVEESTEAFLALQASTVAALSSDINLAEQELTYALQSFSTANSIVEKDYELILSVAKLIPIVGNQVESRQNLLSAGSHLALGNTYLVKGIGDVQKNPDKPLTERLDILQRHLKSALPQYNEALSFLNKVDPKTIPLEYQDTFGEFKILFGVFIDDMKDLSDLANSINTIFGDDSFKRYLVVFQNHHELRPTGGFMGSFAVVDIQKGKILNIDVPGGGTYDLRGQFTEFVKPPLPLQLLNNRWEFQDANWFPDFAASAQKMEWFYEHGRGATADGVIAVNASVLERVLKVLGPVSADELMLAQDDVLEKIQYKVEVDYDKEKEQPKDILAEVLNQLMLSLEDLKSADAVALLTELHNALREKELQVYMNDKDVQNDLRKFGWTGEILPTSGAQDYLGVFHTNIQGQKSDAKIKQTITHEAVVDEDGSIIDTVIIKRTHTGTPGERFYGGQNISYVRMYVPEGAELLSASGFEFPPEEAFRVPENWYENDKDLQKLEQEIGVHLGTGTRITNEFGKTVFGNWVITPAGETSQIYFRYKLPFKVSMSEMPENNLAKWQSVFVPSGDKQTSHYSLAVQKQSGISSDFYSTIIYPKAWFPVWKSNDNINLALNGARYNSVLETDEVIGIVLERNTKNNQ